MSGIGDSSRVNFGILPAGNAASATAANPAASVGAGIATGASAAVTSGPFSLGAGDPGAAGKAGQSTLFSLGIQKLGGTTTTSSPASSSSTLTASATTTSAPLYGTGGGLTFSQPAAATTSSAPSFGSGTSFSFSNPVAVTTTTSTPTFGAGSTLSFPQTPATTTTTTSASSFGIGSTLSSSLTAAPTAATSATPSFVTGSALSFSLPASSTTFTAPVTSTPSLAAATTGQTTLGTSTTVTNSSAASTSSLNFCQLEEAINKWTLELEEQEKSFMNQALQVNSWDRLLIANGEKIINLNDAVEQVKLEQKQLDHELDFILAQQRELEDLLTPLEKELETNGVSDPERESTYKLAEDLDIQLKQMSEDLKEIVEHINETNRTQDNSDPIVQIGRILNAHMNSLQWIDQNTTLIGSHLEQVSKLQEVHRRENERSFRHTYDKF